VPRGPVANLIGLEDDLPCADFGLLVPVKRSEEYAAIRKRVADPKPVDAWRMGIDNYFVFELRPAADAAEVPSFALFKIRWEDYAPALAVVVTPSADGAEVQAVDLRQGGPAYKVSLSKVSLSEDADRDGENKIRVRS
jgi:hypothetical protein